MESTGKNSPHTGFSLIETLVYVFVTGLLLSALVGTLVSLTSSYRSVRSGQAIGQTALVGPEIMVREIRGAQSIDAAGSVLGVSPGRLILNYLDETDHASTTEFYLNSERVWIKRDSVLVGPLSPLSARVTSLIFRLISGTNSKAVKVEMTVESGAGANYKLKQFYSTAVMRGSYLLQ